MTSSAKRGPSGADIQATLIDTAMLLGYRVAHFRAAQTVRGWRTPVEGHAGFVDLVLARDGVVFLWEVKGRGDRLSADQEAWQSALGASARVITAADLDCALAALHLGQWPTDERSGS